MLASAYRFLSSSVQKHCVGLSLQNTPKTRHTLFVLHHQVTLVCYLKCLRGCQNVFSKALGGDWGTISTAHCNLGRLNIWPDLCSARFVFVLLLPMMSFVFKGAFIEGLFNSREVPLSSPSIRRAAIARFLLFDLASFQSEAAASPFIYPAIGHCKHSSVCLCICVSLGLCV